MKSLESIKPMENMEEHASLCENCRNYLVCKLGIEFVGEDCDDSEGLTEN